MLLISDCKMAKNIMPLRDSMGFLTAPMPFLSSQMVMMLLVDMILGNCMCPVGCCGFISSGSCVIMLDLLL